MMQMLGYALLVILALSTPAAAVYSWNGFSLQGNADNPAWAYNGTVANGTVVGDVYISCGHGMDETGPMNNPVTDEPYIQSFNVPAGNVTFAHMYIAVWHSRNDLEGKLKFNYTNVTGTYTLYANGTDGAGNLTLGGVNDINDNVWCTSCGVTWAWYDVKDYVTTGDNIATAYTYKIGNNTFDGRVQSIKLIVVYENASEYEVRYWINQGHDTLTYALDEDNPAKDYGYTYFNGIIDPAEWEYAMLYCTWYAGDQWDHDTLWFNGIELDNSCTNYEQGTYLDTRWYVVKNETIDYLKSTDNNATFYRDIDNYVHWIGADLVLFRVTPRPDLVVTSIADPVLVDHDSTHGYVVGHDYTVNATIKNQGKIPSDACSATLYNASGIVDTVSVPALDTEGFCEVVFNWHPYASGDIELNVTVDSLGAINESDETNNARQKNVNVLPAGDPDLNMSAEDLVFLPTRDSNEITIRITVTNLGTGDANNFVVRTYDGSTEINTTSMDIVAAKGDKVFDFTYSNAPHGGPYPITVVLDADDNVGESDEDNNETTKDLHVIEVMLWDSHHHGNTSTYNGEYSKNNDVAMFKVTKLVPENTTSWDALHSVANVTHRPTSTATIRVSGIDGLMEDTMGKIYWYLYFNGRYVSNNDQWGVIEMQDGETAHWDFQKSIYPEHGIKMFTPPCTVQSYPVGDDLYPEPFTHGFPMGAGSGDGHSRTVWNTIIVYPAVSPDFLGIANDIRDTLITGGVPGGRITITNDTAITGNQKNNSNLILIGSYTANSLIVDVNTQHEEIGMPVYFNYTSCEIVEDDDISRTPYDPLTYDHGGVVEAFDNPWNNNASFSTVGSVIFMASGLNNGDAMDAAKMLVSETDELNKFWRVRQMMCGDADCDGQPATNVDVQMTFDEVYSSRYAVDVDCDGTPATNVDVTDMFNEVLSCCTCCNP